MAGACANIRMFRRPETLGALTDKNNFRYAQLPQPSGQRPGGLQPGLGVASCMVRNGNFAQASVVEHCGD
jgi:hypothetical protein